MMAQPHTAGNLLSADSLSTFMAASLPKDANGLRNPYEAVALAVHAGMIAVGFRLVGLGEDHKIGKFELFVLYTIPWPPSIPYLPCRQSLPPIHRDSSKRHLYFWSVAKYAFLDMILRNKHY
jgi:hypothetical protein